MKTLLNLPYVRVTTAFGEDIVLTRGEFFALRIGRESADSTPAVATSIQRQLRAKGLIYGFSFYELSLRGQRMLMEAEEQVGKKDFVPLYEQTVK